MSSDEIAAAARLIRPILASQLSLCKAVYPPAHPDAAHTASIESAIKAFDRMVASMKPIEVEKQPDVTE